MAISYLGRRFIAGARYEPTTYQIFMSGSAWPTIDKSQICKELQKFAAPVNRQLRHSLRAEKEEVLGEVQSFTENSPA